MRTVEKLPNGYTLLQEDGLLRLTLDAAAVARETAIRAPQGARIADAGAGVGAATMLLCSVRPDVRVTAFELDDRADAVLRDNIAQNGLTRRVTAVRGDLRDTAAQHGIFDAVVCNPPYRADCTAAHDNERCSAALPPEHLAAAARTLLRPRGRLFAIVAASRLLDYCSAFSGAGIEPKRLTFVTARTDAKPSLVLIEAASGARHGGLIVEPLITADTIASFFNNK